MQQIQKFHMTRLLGGAIAEFHNSFITIVKDANLNVLHIQDLFPSYQEAVDTLNVIVTKSTRLTNTREIAQADDIRDRSINRFFKLIKDLKNSPNPVEKPMGLFIWDIILHYEGLSKYEMNKQTVMVKGMLQDLNKPEARSYIEQLNLVYMIDEIQIQNDRMAELMMLRIDGEAEKESTKTVEQRKIVNTLYDEVVLYINATAVLEPEDMVNRLIEKVNTLIDEYRRMIANMRPGGSGNESLPKKEKPEVITEEDEEYSD